jgi:sec-independent protein translocase protein TatA
MEALTPWHLLLILIGFIVLFGYDKLPDASRSLGRSLRIFKTEMHALNDDVPTDRATTAPTVPSRTEVAVTALEAEAAAAEARAAELRARANVHALRADVPPGPEVRATDDSPARSPQV